MRSILIAQVILAISAALAGYLWSGGGAALAALFGVAVALINVLMLTWRMRQGKRALHADPQRHLRAFYYSALERWLVVSMLLALGIGALKLTPLAVLAAFIAGQLVLIMAGTLSRKH